MIDEPPPYKGLSIRIPLIVPIQGSGWKPHDATVKGRFRFGWNMSCKLGSHRSLIGFSGGWI